MPLKTGLTERTIVNLQLNAGVLLTSYTKGEPIDEEDIIGATRGGGSFTAVPTVHQAAVDGAPTYMKGLERVDDWVVTMNTTMLEFSDEGIARALGAGVTKTESGSGTTKDVTFKVDRTIKDAEYKDIYWVGDLSNGQNVVINLKNALNISGFSLTVSDRGEGTYPLALIAHYTVDDLETAPFEITIERATGV